MSALSELPRPEPDAQHYLLGHRAEEDERLRQQPLQLAADATWLLDQLGIQPGWRAIDVGCGPQGIIDLLAERVGPQGSVVGIDQSESAVALARQFVATHALRNVEIFLGNARATNLPRGSFDVAHLRLVLVNVRNPGEIVAELVGLVRSGGVVAVHEYDWAGSFLEPAHPAWDRVLGAFNQLGRELQIDLSIGRRLPALMREAGLVDVEVRPIAHAYPVGHFRRKIFLQLSGNVRHELVSHGLMSDAELTNDLANLHSHIDDPKTLVLATLYVQAWGPKP